MKERINYVVEDKMVDEEVEVPDGEESLNYKITFNMVRCCPFCDIPERNDWQLGATIVHKKGIGFGDQFEVWKEIKPILKKVGIKDDFLVSMLGILKDC
jgi:hypothetical protein